MSKKEKGKWDGRSRIPTAVYKHNYNEIFGNKTETKQETNKNDEKLYGQQEQEDLDESMKEAFRQRDERLKKLTYVGMFLLLTGCSEFLLLSSGASIAVSQSPIAKAYSGADMITIMSTDKDIKKHAYDKIKGKNETQQ
jgi:hypothetical protein|tara:strand:+ start:254 stop:670 length:417 start_codon:yes stop_codon:yes gene_type:complete